MIRRRAMDTYNYGCHVKKHYVDKEQRHILVVLQSKHALFTEMK